MKIYFATDVHGSEICWKKFLAASKFYDVDTLILGGDMTGKAIIPIIAQGDDNYKVTLLEQMTILHGKEEVDKMVQTIQNRGYYPYLTNPDEVQAISSTPGKTDALFLEQVIKTMQHWMEYADSKLSGTGIRCYVCPGNDDMFEIDAVIAGSKCVRSLEGQVIELDEHHEMANSGWSNPTPWQTHREESEEALLARLESVISKVKNPSPAGLIFLGFLDWLLVVWFWDPNVLPESLPAVGTYAIGWSNVPSMIFMLINYLLAAAIYFGFSYYRRRQGIEIEKVYKEIPVE
jgi:Icc-related predicted phosphoesterase